MNDSVDWFKDQPVNQRRVSAGRLPATNVWLWGLGRRPRLEPFEKLHGVSGAMITAVDLLRGLAALIGWKSIEVPGATGYIDTDYSAKGRYAIQALDEYDLVCVHIEAPDEASHEGNAQKKIAALEHIDEQIVAPVLARLQSYDQWRIMVTPDHPTFVKTKTHSHGDVPFAICGTGIQPDTCAAYHEANAAASSLVFVPGWHLMKFFLSSHKITVPES
jgi:2,3-bisphosphoglycerate-independent phosphoglycerate mutase